MDNNENNEELIDENLQPQPQVVAQPQKIKQEGLGARAYDAIQDYRDAGGIKGIAKNAIDNKKNEIKDNIKNKVDNKKNEIKDNIKNKVDSKLPESVKQKRDAAKAKSDAMKNKMSDARQKVNDIKSAPDQLKQKLNEKAFRTGVKSAVNLAAPGLGEVANQALDTKLGEKAIEAARESSTPTSAVTEGSKVLISGLLKRELAKKIGFPLIIFFTLLIVFLVIISSVSKFAPSFDFLKGSNTGEIGLDAIEEDYKKFYELVEKYGNSNPAMVIATLTAHTDNDQYDKDSDIDDTVDSCTEEEIEKGDCIAEQIDGILTYSKSKMKKYIKKVNKAITESGGDVTEGYYNDPQNTGSKFFRWLYNDFVEDFYSDFINKNDVVNSKQRIIREIYLLYEELSSNNAYCKNSFVNLSCPQVTVTGTGAGSYALEDYVAAVVANELGYSGYPEAIRAQAIAARTYLFSVTNTCQKSIENSTNAQTLNASKVNDEIRQAVEDTAGMVLTKDGKIFMSQYSTFSPNMSCSGSVCTGTFYRQPSKTETTITIDVSKIGFNEGNLLGGHAYGMSQYGALYLDKVENKTYEEILKTFYDEDIEISSTTSTNIEGAGGYCGSTTSGLVQVEGYAARLLRPQRNNAFYYDQSSNFGANGWLEGECAWYASARAQEVLSTLGSDVTWTYNGHGGSYCDAVNYDKNKFETSTDINSPREGAIISWKAGLYGHVAVVEKVEGNKVTISEAGLSFGPTLLYGCSTGSCVRRFVTSTATQRRTYCEANGSGCFNTSTVDVSVLQRYGGQFQCYIYLGSPK